MEKKILKDRGTKRKSVGKKSEDEVQSLQLNEKPEPKKSSGESRLKKRAEDTRNVGKKGEGKDLAY